MVALIGRGDTIDWLLLFHILVAVLLVAGSAAVTVSSLLALKSTVADRATFYRQTAFRINLLVVLPAFILVNVFGEAVADKEHLQDSTPDWLEAGRVITLLGGIVGAILLTLLQWWVLRRARKDELRGWQAAVATYTAPLVLAALFVVVFLMSAKPGSGIEAPG